MQPSSMMGRRMEDGGKYVFRYMKRLPTDLELL